MTAQPCLRCEQERRITARGLCRPCYMDLRRAGTLDRYPATGQRGRPPGSRKQVARYTDWRAVADARKGEIDMLRARIAELEQTR